MQDTQQRILFCNTDYTGGAWYRILTPSTTLQNSHYAHTVAYAQPLDEASIKVLAPDVVVFQHHASDPEIQTLRMYRKALPKAFFIYDIDDAFWAVPKESLHFAALPKDIELRIITAANLCDRIITPTDFLASKMREKTKVKDIQVLPNMLRAANLQQMTSTRRKTRTQHEKPRVGWIGGIGHAGDIEVLEHLVQKLHDEVQFVFMGMTPEKVDQAWLEIHEPVPIQEYHQKLASLDLDLALAPLADNEFNRCKSSLRVVEYGACGYPVIASDIEPYKHFTNITRLPFLPHVWETAVREALRNPSALEEQGEKLYAEINTHHKAETHVQKLANAFTPPKKTFHLPSSQPVSDGLLIVGGEVEGYTSANSFEEALTYPTADVLWLAPDTQMRAEDATALAEKTAAMGVGSASAFTNDGLYPVQGQFVPLQNDVVSAIRVAAETCANTESIVVPYPIGSAVVLRAAVLAAIGAPDMKRFGSRAVALLDWGARATEAGFSAVLAPGVFAHALKHHDDGENEEAVRASQAWNPVFTQELSRFKHHEQVAFAAQSIELMLNREQYKHPATSKAYQDWFQVFASLSPNDKDRVKEELKDWKTLPTFSIIMPVYNPDLEAFREAIASVEAQIYPHWELLIVDDASTNPAVWGEINFAAERDPRIKIKRRDENGHICAASNDAIEMASGEWMICLDNDDTIEDYALYAVAKTIVEKPDLQFIYSDCDKISPEGNLIDPYFAPDFNYDLLLAQNYVTHLSAYRLDKVKELGGYVLGTHGSQDWDMVLRYLPATCGFPIDRSKIHHIQQVLYHWRQSDSSAAGSVNAKPYAYPTGRKAVLDHLKATNQAAAMQPHPLSPSFNMVRYLMPKELPLASIIIQTRDNPEQLGQCINSLVDTTLYGNYEIIVLDNGWKKNALRDVKHKDRVTLVANTGPFNYAAANNKGAELAKGELLCFLNDDTQIIESAWLNDLCGAALRPWVGAVGPRLIYADGTVQQCGTMINMDAPFPTKAIHAFQRNHIQNPGTVGRGVLASEWAAVSGACMVIRKSVYTEMNGMDAKTFPRDYNDVDLCLRLMQKNYVNVTVAHILVLHHEAQTKSRWKQEHDAEALRADEAALVARHGSFVDPYWNKNLAFTPNLDQISGQPPKIIGAEDEMRERVLVVNGNHEIALWYYAEGYLPYCASLNGHQMAMNYPRMDRVNVMDTRDPPADLLFVCQLLGITKVILHGIGEGTYGILPHLQQLEEYGLVVEYNPIPAPKEEMLPDPIKAFLWASATKMNLDDAAQS